ncbi:MAG: acyl-CoA dehydrogenase family protein [Desulfobacterales bacterium]
MVDFSLNETDQTLLDEARVPRQEILDRARYYDYHEDEISPDPPTDQKGYEAYVKTMGDRAKTSGACTPGVFGMVRIVNQIFGSGAPIPRPEGGAGGGLGNASLRAAGTDEQKKKWGKMNLAMANTEPGCGSDSKAIETTAVRDGDEWVLNGEKIFVTGGIRCQGVVVWATIDKSAGRGGIKSFVVMKGTPGFDLQKKEKKMGIRVSDTAAFVLKDCRVPRANVLGLDEDVKTGGGGFKGLMKTFNMTRPGVAAGGTGHVNSAFHFVTEALKKEGVEVDWETGSHRRSAVQEKMIELETQIEASALTIYRATWLAEKGQPNNLESSVSKAKGGDVSRTGAQLAIELLGAIGITHDQLVEKAFRDARITDIYEGTGEINRLVTARAILNYGSADLM